MSLTHLDLPSAVGNNLVMRWASSEDAEALAVFNAEIHADGPEPDEAVAAWTRDLLSGHHPTVKASDFTVVVDEADRGKIVSSLMLISQTWAYAGIAFGVGRPELVGTLPDYRQRGLVRMQMDVIHSLSASRGELVQAITGIPWFYRQFGYEQTVSLGGSRLLVWDLRGALKAPEVVLRPAGRGDIPALQQLYARHTAHSLLACMRDEAVWAYMLEHSSPTNVNHRHYRIVQSVDGELLGYCGFYKGGDRLGLTELAACQGVSLRDFAIGVANALRAEAEMDPLATGKTPHALRFALGASHPAYTVLGGLLERQDPPYAWYLRVPDLVGFLHRITPVLEQRLEDSILARATIDLKLNFYGSNLQLSFEEGKLTGIGPYEPKSLMDGHASFPDLTFLHILFGHLTLDQLSAVRPDSYASYANRKPLLEILFPQQPSAINPLS